MGLPRGLLLILWLAAIVYCNPQPRKNKPYITALHVTTDIKFHFATTLVTSVMLNPLERSAEATFDIILPNAAFISNFTLEIDEKIYPAIVKDKEEAKQEYERAKSKGETAGHVSSRPRETNKFRVEVNVAAGSVVVFNLTYQEVLHRRLSAYESVVYLDFWQVVEDLKIQVYIEESRPLSLLHVPPLKNDLLTIVDITDTNPLAIVDRPSPNQAYILFQPTAEQQRARSENGINALFTVRYDIERDYDAGDLLVVNGYFVHFLAPAISEPIPKDIVFVLDKSGSMSGTKMKQLKDAMHVILKDLDEEDRFNIITFSHQIKKWRKKLVAVTETHIKEGLVFADGIKSNGYTDINNALLKGLEMLQKGKREDSQPIIMFLSDGQPSSGETNVPNILTNTAGANVDGVPIYSLAFGNDADWDMSRGLSSQSGAVARRIYEDSDATLQMTNFYKEVSTTLLTGVKVKYLEDQVQAGTVTTSQFNSFFEGSEMVIAGKLADNAQTLTVDVEATSKTGLVNFEIEDDVSDLPSASSLTSLGDVQKITEKMWAYLTIKEMLKEMDETADLNRRAQIQTQATDLSLRYNFVTPLTSMVVTKPDEEELDGLQEEDSDADDYDYDDPSSYGGGDPHFMISMRSLPYPVCFDVKGYPGRFYRLLKDPVNDLTINTNMEQGITIGMDGNLRSFMTKMNIRYKDLVVTVSLQVIRMGDQQLHWQTGDRLESGDNRVEVDGYFLRISLDIGVDILIRKIIKHDQIPKRIDFLNIEIDRDDLLSTKTSGLLGQFAHRELRVKEKETTERRVNADLWVEHKGKVIAKGLGRKRVRNNFVLQRNKTCFDVSTPTQLFDVNPDSFEIPSFNAP